MTSVSEWSVFHWWPPSASSSVRIVGVVVDLAVEHDLQRAVFVGHRLVRHRRQIDDRQPAVAEADAAVGGHPEPAAIGAAVDHRVAHPPDVRLGDGERGVIEREATNNSAHEI